MSHARRAADLVRSWPMVRQLTGPDPLGRGAAVRVGADRGTWHARTPTPTRVTKSICPFCAVGCGQQIFAKDGRVTHVEGDPDSPISRGRLCPKGSSTLSLITAPTRQTRSATGARTAPSGRTSTSTPPST